MRITLCLSVTTSRTILPPDIPSVPSYLRGLDLALKPGDNKIVLLG